MKTFFATTLCIICCLNKMTTNEKFCYINEDKKQKFESFLKSKTNIKANSSDECNRIFAKVLNTLAFFRNSQGSYRGSLSKDIITKEAVVYNRENFRDKNSKKPKVLTRQEHEESSKGNERKSSKGSVRKARNELNEFNKQYRNYKSEHIEKNEEADATVTHHIFPQKPYSEISSHLENLISLTPTQHSNYAHNNNRTKETSKTYQRLLLLSKIERIKEHLSDSKIEKKIYKFSNLLYVLSVGFNNKDILNIEDGDFDAVIDAINRHYAS